MTEHKDHGDIQPPDAEDGKGKEPHGGHGAGERPLDRTTVRVHSVVRQRGVQG